MDEDSLKLNIQNLEEYIIDEEKIVTYLWLSKKLCLEVNHVKLLLERYVEYHRKKFKNIPISVSYISCNRNKTDHSMTVLTEEEHKNSCTEDISFRHIYGIRKGNNTFNYNDYILVNSLLDFEPILGAIKNFNGSKRSESEIDKLRHKSYNGIDQHEIKIDKKESHMKNNGAVAKSSKANLDKKDISDSNLQSDTRSDHTKINTDPLLTEPKKPDVIQSKISKQAPTPNKGKGIAGFFKKQPSKINNDKILNGPLIENTIKKLNEKGKLDDNNMSEKKLEIEKIISKASSNIETVTKEKTKISPAEKKRLNEIKISPKSKKVQSKRKRVLHVSDSDVSENEAKSNDENDPFENSEEKIEESDEEIPATPMTDLGKVKITSSMINPRKRRKIVDKTYTDDDGYILTRKEEVYESCSDEEVIEAKCINNGNSDKPVVKDKKSPVTTDKIQKASKNTKTKKKVNSPGTGKQSMLTNFFSKKP